MSAELCALQNASAASAASATALMLPTALFFSTDNEAASPFLDPLWLGTVMFGWAPTVNSMLAVFALTLACLLVPTTRNISAVARGDPDVGAGNLSAAAAATPYLASIPPTPATTTPALAPAALASASQLPLTLLLAMALFIILLQTALIYRMYSTQLSASNAVVPSKSFTYESPEDDLDLDSLSGLYDYDFRHD